MKRTALALIMALLFSAVAGTILVKLTSANPLPPVYPTITMDSPQNVPSQAILSF